MMTLHPLRKLYHLFLIFATLLIYDIFVIIFIILTKGILSSMIIMVITEIKKITQAKHFNN